MKRLQALEALGRGIANVRANWPVLVAYLAGTLVVVLIVIASVFPWVAAFGPGLSKWMQGSAGTGLLGIAPSSIDPSELLARFGAAFLAFTLGLTVGSLVFCWYMGGILGVLVAGDAQAPAGPGRAPVVFRTWSWRLFVAESNRLAWKLMLYYSVFMALLLGVMILIFGLVALIGLSLDARGGGVALAVGCGGALPLLFALFVVYAATLTGQAELARPGVRVGSAVRLAFHVLGRRLGGIVVLLVLLFVAAFAVGLVAGGLNLVLGGAAAAKTMALPDLGEGAILVFEMLANSILNVIALATVVALARSETPNPSQVRPA